MANARALTIQSGQMQELAVVDSLLLSGIEIPAATASAFVLEEGSTPFLQINTDGATDDLIIGDFGANPPNVSINVTGNGVTGSTSAFLLRDNSSNILMQADTTSSAQITLGDGSYSVRAIVPNTGAGVFAVQDGTGAQLFAWNTSTNQLNIQNTIGNGITRFFGSGEVIFDGDAITMTEQPTDPGLTAGFGKSYTKSVSAITELFYQDSVGNVVQITSGGAVNSTATPAGADTQVQFNNAGVFGGDADFTFDGTNVTLVNALFANGGVDRSAAAALSIGTTNANSILIGAVGVTTTIQGDLQVDGAETVTGTSTFTDSATFNGDVTFGKAVTDTVEFISRIGTVAQPDFHFLKEVNHIIDVDQSTTSSTVGGSLTLASAIGADATGAGNDAANGGAFIAGSGAGGDGNTADLAANSGLSTFTSGPGGAGTATVVGGDSGSVILDVGAAGVTGGAGAGSTGDVSISGTNATATNIGGATGPALNILGAGNTTWGSTVARLFGADGDFVVGAVAMSGTERLRVVGDARIEGKLTVTGSLDPTDLILSGGGTAHFIESSDGVTATVSGATTGKFRYNDTTGTWQVSTQGGAYVDVATGSTSPGGANTQVQYNSAGAFAGDPDFTFDGTNVTMANALFAQGGIDLSAAGTLNFGETNATSVIVGNATTQTMTLNGTVSITVPDDSATALDISEGATAYMQIITTNGSESVIMGTTATETITLDGTVSVTLAGATASAMSFAETAVSWININTSATPRQGVLGDGASDIEWTFEGTGKVSIDGEGLFLAEQAGDAVTGANEGALYTKLDGGITNLFFRSESNGTVTQITPISTGDATAVVINKTANENIAAGAPVNIANDGGNPRIREADANVAARQRVVGLAQAAILSAAAGDVVTQGEVPVPDAQWAALPAVANVGDPVYLSTTVGELTLTAPSGNVTVVDVGTVLTGGTGAVTVLVNVKLPVKTI